MRIEIKIGKVELNYEEDTDPNYPLITIRDSWKYDLNKSERLMQVILALCDKAIEMHNHTKQPL
jgi:hypothetical protein